jgi:hypothetical protein
MVTARRTLRTLVGAAAVACSGSTPSNKTGADAANDGLEAQGTPDVAADASGGPATNVAPVVVDNGPAAVQAVNTLYTTVTLCRPGTTICQTIDHIEVDTGSTGVRILSSLLEPALMLPQQMAADGNPLVECYRYADGYNWGPVATADVHIGGELAAAVPIQIAGGAGSTPIPTDCSSAGTEEDTVIALGGNGLIGIGFQTADCGGTCAGANPPNGAYYSCTSTACTVASVPIPQQLQNPVGLFARDNNGVAVRLPAIDPAGAATVMGSLIFGIGTAPNNGLGAAQVLTTDTTNGYFTTTFSAQSATGGQSPPATLVGFIDSGSLSYALPDTSIPQCSGSAPLMGFFCPPMGLTLMATNTGHNHVSIVTPFSVAAADGLYGSGHAAFDDLAITDFGPGGYFDWGLPFFFGRTVFSAISGAMTPGGVGPYFAY